MKLSKSVFISLVLAFAAVAAAAGTYFYFFRGDRWEKFEVMQTDNCDGAPRATDDILEIGHRAAARLIASGTTLTLLDPLLNCLKTNSTRKIIVLEPTSKNKKSAIAKRRMVGEAAITSLYKVPFQKLSKVQRKYLVRRRTSLSSGKLNDESFILVRLSLIEAGKEPGL